MNNILLCNASSEIITYKYDIITIIGKAKKLLHLYFLIFFPLFFILFQLLFFVFKIKNNYEGNC
jgi:hypothetical protein